MAGARGEGCWEIGTSARGSGEGVGVGGGSSVVDGGGGGGGWVVEVSEMGCSRIPTRLRTHCCLRLRLRTAAPAYLAPAQIAHTAAAAAPAAVVLSIISFHFLLLLFYTLSQTHARALAPEYSAVVCTGA